MIDSKNFFDVPVKNKEEAYEKIIEMSRNNDYTAGNLLDYEYFSKHYRLSAKVLSRQIELENPDLKQQIKKIKQQCFLSLKKQKKLLLISHIIL